MLSVASEADRARALGAQARKAQSLQDFLGARNNPLVTEKLKLATHKEEPKLRLRARGGSSGCTQAMGFLLGICSGSPWPGLGVDIGSWRSSLVLVEETKSCSDYELLTVMSWAGPR